MPANTTGTWKYCLWNYDGKANVEEKLFVRKGFFKARCQVNLPIIVFQIGLLLTHCSLEFGWLILNFILHHVINTTVVFLSLVSKERKTEENKQRSRNLNEQGTVATCRAVRKPHWITSTAWMYALRWKTFLLGVRTAPWNSGDCPSSFILFDELTWWV